MEGDRGNEGNWKLLLGRVGGGISFFVTLRAKYTIGLKLFLDEYHTNFLCEAENYIISLAGRLGS